MTSKKRSGASVKAKAKRESEPARKPKPGGGAQGRARASRVPPGPKNFSQRQTKGGSSPAKASSKKLLPRARMKSVAQFKREMREAERQRRDLEEEIRMRTVTQAYPLCVACGEEAHPNVPCAEAAALRRFTAAHGEPSLSQQRRIRETTTTVGAMTVPPQAFVVEINVDAAGKLDTVWRRPEPPYRLPERYRVERRGSGHSHPGWAEHDQVLISHTAPGFNYEQAVGSRVKVHAECLRGCERLVSSSAPTPEEQEIIFS